MYRKTKTLLALLPSVVLVLAGCRTDDGMHRPGSDEASQAADTTRLGKIYDDISESYTRLMARHDEMEQQMSPEVEQLYEQMQEMHGRAGQMRSQMMADYGAMMDSPMMGRRMMGEGMMERDTMGRGILRGGMDMMGMHRMREWDRQMMAMHERMAAMHRQHGDDEMTAMHERMMQSYRRALDASEGAPPAEAPSLPEGGTLSGTALFAQECSTCHGAQGGGRMGIFPPLAGSEWVTGDEQVPIRIVLHGLEGPIEVRGQAYDGVMPPFGARLSDEEIATVLTHLRTSWGNNASAIAAHEVTAVRQTGQGRTAPWSPSELQRN